MTATTIVQQVHEWYARHSAQFLKGDNRMSIRSMDDIDMALGKVAIRITTPRTLGSVTFWNNGNVSALAINKETKQEYILDDRPLQQVDSVPSLLDRYVREITELDGPNNLIG